MEFDPPQSTGEPAAAGPSASQGSPSNGASRHKFVSFFLGEKHYAMPAHSVGEVVGRLTPTRLPDSPHGLLGIAPLRGDILAIVDAGASAAPIEVSKQKAVVLRPQSSSVDVPIAFNVDRLGELLQIADDEIRLADDGDPLASFESNVDGRSVLIIEPARIQNLLSAAEQ